MTTAWIVYGEAGAYSDHTMWIVRAFDSKEEAEAFVKLLEETPIVVEEIQNAYHGVYKQHTHPLDPQYRHDHGYDTDRTQWSVAEVPRGFPEGL